MLLVFHALMEFLDFCRDGTSFRVSTRRWSSIFDFPQFPKIFPYIGVYQIVWGLSNCDAIHQAVPWHRLEWRSVAPTGCE